MKDAQDLAKGTCAARTGPGHSETAGTTARDALAGLAAGGSAAYDRQHHLERLLALWPEEIADTSAAGRLRIVARLRTAMRAERVRGRAGHWTYDLNRHMALAAALKFEMAGLGHDAGRKLRPDQHGPAHRSSD